jgi:hypothetical protein
MVMRNIDAYSAHPLVGYAHHIAAILYGIGGRSPAAGSGSAIDLTGIAEIIEIAVEADRGRNVIKGIQFQGYTRAAITQLNGLIHRAQPLGGVGNMKIIHVIVAAGRKFESKSHLHIASRHLHRIEYPAIDGQPDIAYAK